MPSLTSDAHFDPIEERLGNGVLVLLLRDPSVPLVSFQVHVAAGSRNERPGITGISHLFEHMMFRGTPTVGPQQFACLIQEAGGTLNAFTTEDSTAYYETLPSGRLDLAVRLEADRFANLLLTEENLATEREVVRNERRQRTDNTPYGPARELIMEMAFLRHPYRWPVVGWDPDLVALDLEDCRTYFRRHYAPGQLSVIASGDVGDEALDRIRAGFGALPAAPPPDPVRTTEGPQQGERRGIVERRVEAAALFAGFHVPGAEHVDTPALMVLARILSGGESSRLHRRFVRSGRTGPVHAALGTSALNRDPTLFRVEAVAHPGQDMETIEPEIWEEVGRIAQEGIDPEEVRRAIRQLAADLALQTQTRFAAGLHLGLSVTRTGDWRFANRLPQAWREVTPEDVRRVAETWLQPANRTVVLVRPLGDA